MSSTTPLHADVTGDSTRTISWEDSALGISAPSAYSLKWKDGKGVGTSCEGGWSQTCDPNLGSVEIKNFFPMCDSNDGMDFRLDCLDTVFAEVNGKVVKGELVESPVGVWGKDSFEAKPELGIAKTQPYRIYKFAGLNHSKGELFRVQVLKSNFINSGKVENSEYTYFVAPTFLANLGNYCTYILTPEGLCWSTGSYDSDTKIVLSVKLAKPPLGWFSGRITEPTVKVSTSADSRTQVIFTGTSQAVPSIHRIYNYSNLVERNKLDLISKSVPWLAWGTQNIEGKEQAYSVYTFTSQSMTEFRNALLGDPSLDNADTVQNFWRVDSRPYALSPVAPRCFESMFTGLVSSNSMTYENSVPSWNAQTSSLIYGISSPHTALGKEFIGRYDLLISKQAGQCLWNLKTLSPSAVISVTSATGEKKVFSASSSISDGFYKFTATGFTFSANTISIKLVSENPTPTPVKKTITCTKGKTQKKVSAVNPKCPAGYKKKI